MSCNNKWAKLILNSEETINLTEIDGFDFIKYEKHKVIGETETLKRSGVDGVIPGSITFDMFDIKLTFRYTGEDSKDVDLFLQKLDDLLFREKPYYLVHSITPNKKYAVLPTPDITPTMITIRHYDIDITFQCYKGYSESLYDTDNFNLSDGLWQFESGVLPDSTIKYEHTRQKFEILNGSSGTINPRLGHKLKIYMRIDATNGFKLINTTTGDIFEYKKALDSNDRLLLDGAYPWLLHNSEDKRCGRSTNHGVITLAPGINKFEIWGKVNKAQTKFTFPFIYR